MKRLLLKKLSLPLSSFFGYTYLFFYNIFVLLSNQFPFIFIVLSIIYIINCYLFLSKGTNFDRFIVILIYLIPTSFISVIGSSFELFPLSWFHLFLVFLVIYSVIKKINIKFLFTSLIFFTIAFFQFFIHNLDFLDSLKQLFNIFFLYFGSFFIGYSYFNKSNLYQKLFLLASTYIISVLVFSIQIFIQFFNFRVLNLRFGYLEFYSSNRVTFGALFSDFSFSSLYIASGIIILLFLPNIRFKLVCLFIFILSIIIVNARTGQFVSIIFFLYFLLKRNKKIINLTIGFLILSFLITLILNFELVISISGNPLFNDSGRIDLIEKAIPLIFNNFLFGIGSGTMNLVKNSSLFFLPHNSLIQYLLQFGFLGISLLLLPLISTIIKSTKNNYIFFSTIGVLIGSMFIPDIISSRFFTALTIIFLQEINIINRGKYLNETSRKIIV